MDLESLPTVEDLNDNHRYIRYVEGLNDPEDITGGYLLELDKIFSDTEPSCFHSFSATVVCKQPEFLSRNAISYISLFFDEAQTCMRKNGRNPDTGKTLFEYFDRNSLVNEYLIQQWILNNDYFVSSTFFYKPADEDLLYSGPLWDCDASFGTLIGLDDPHEWNRNSISKYFVKSAAFQTAVTEIYAASFRSLLTDGLFGDGTGSAIRPFTAFIREITPSALMNDTLWPRRTDSRLFTSKPYTWQNFNDMLVWAAERTAWMDGVLTSAPVITKQPADVTVATGTKSRLHRRTGKR